MSSKNKSVPERTPTESKSFSYKKGNVTLQFNLRTDVKDELKDLVSLLEAGAEDVRKEINIRFPPSQKIGEGSGESKARHSRESAEILGRLFGVNRQYISDLKKIREKSPELFEKIKLGNKTIQEAKKELKAMEIEREIH